jgi:hypothetical protein
MSLQITKRTMTIAVKKIDSIGEWSLQRHGDNIQVRLIAFLEGQAGAAVLRVTNCSACSKSSENKYT